MTRQWLGRLPLSCLLPSVLAFRRDHLGDLVTTVTRNSRFEIIAYLATDSALRTPQASPGMNRHVLTNLEVKIMRPIRCCAALGSVQV